MKFTTEPHIEKHPNDAVPLVAMVYFKADGKAATTLEIDNGKKKRSVTFDETHDPEQGLPVIGMRANSEHWVTVKTGDADAVKLTYCTPPLPENPREMPNIELVTSKADEMAPGWTILSIRRRPITRAIWMTQKQFEFQNRWSLLVILDEEGEVVWYYRADSRIAGVHRLQNGNLFYHHVNFRSIEMDLCGNVVKRFHATNRPFGPVENSIGIEAQSLHHQPHEMPNGNYLALTANAREIENYYTSETDPDAPRHRGISCLLTPMDVPGLTAQSLRLASGDGESGLVFLDDVEIPAAQLLGRPGEGWHIAMTTLSHERGPANQGYLAVYGRKLREAQQLAERSGVADCADVRRSLGEAYVRGELLRLGALESLSAEVAGQGPGPTGGPMPRRPSTACCSSWRGRPRSTATTCPRCTSTWRRGR